MRNTSWQKVADWYDKHLGKSGEGTYHKEVILPEILALLQSEFPENSSAHTGSSPLILDLACGQGIITRELDKLGFKVSGLDLAADLIVAAKKYSNKHINYLTGDARQASKYFPGQKFNAILCVLAIQNIAEAELVISESKKLLATNGKLIIVINHPCFRIPRQSNWGWDESKKLQYRRIDLYGTSLSIPIESRPFKARKDANIKNEITWSFHRPLNYYFDILAKQGLSVNGLKEWYSN